jgi:hypothetical protein
MSTARPFAYNTGAPIAGTIQVGNLSVGTPTSGITNSPTFWNGPDEELGYVIAYPVSGGTHPTPISGVTAYLGFLGTKNMSNPLDESTFVELTNNSFNQTFTNGNDASTWLTTNGYWNSWVSITPTPTSTLSVTPTPSVTVTPTNTLSPTPTPSVTTTVTPTSTLTPTPTPTPTSTPTSGVSGDFNVTISQVGSDVVWSGSGSFNLTALTSDGPGSMGGGYNSGQAVWAIGPDTSVDTYSGTITYPASFGTSNVAVTSNTGSTFGILPGGSGRLLYVPSGYVSNTNISGSSTYANKTIASAGLTPGTYTWSWGSGGNASTLVMTITA